MAFENFRSPDIENRSGECGKRWASCNFISSQSKGCNHTISFWTSPAEVYVVAFNSSITLNPGDIGVFFTDGITESRNKDNKEFNEDRLIKLLQKNSKLSAQKLLEKVNQEVEKFTAGAERMDDMTLVIIKRGC